MRSRMVRFGCGVDVELAGGASDSSTVHSTIRVWTIAGDGLEAAGATDDAG